MNVILNVDAITPPLTGIGHYALQLARGLVRHPDISDIRFFSAYRWVADPEQALDANQSLAAVRKRTPCKTLALHFYGWATGRVFRWKAGPFRNYLLHSPNYILHPFSGPSVTTVHDLSFIHYPQHHPRERVLFMERRFPRTLDQATAVITDSDSVRQELIDKLGVSPAKITTVPLGVDACFQPRERGSIRATLDRYALSNVDYLLVVATLEPRKNLLGLLEAYARLSADLRRRHPLVLAGAQGWLNECFPKRLRDLAVEENVKSLGYIPQADLPLLYAGAWAFAYPSLYEGFGLPVLEALASGLPVLTSDRSSLPEVAGGAALLVDPEDVAAMTLGLERLLTDQPWREAASTAGLDQARRFSWRRCVDETVAVYRRAAGDFPAWSR